VLATLESKMASRRCGVQRLSAMPAPARCTTASMGPAFSSASISMLACGGSQATCAEPAGSLGAAGTHEGDDLVALCTQARASAWPIMPWEPLTRMFTCSPRLTLGFVATRARAGP